MRSKYFKQPIETYINVDGFVSRKFRAVMPGIGRTEACKIFAKYNPQAVQVIFKFGNARKLADAIKECCPESEHYNPATIYRWTYPKEAGGTGGVIPAPALKTVIKAARYAGVMLTPEDLTPKL